MIVVRTETPDSLQWSEYLHRFAVPWKGATVLVTGIDATDISHDIGHRREAAEVCSIGAGRDWEREAIRLEQRRFDIVVSHGALSGLTPSEQHSRLLWFADHLAPSGHLVVGTQTFLAPYQPAGVATEGAHIVFPQRALRRYHEEKLGEKPAYASPQTASSYITLFRRAGFEIIATNSVGPCLSEETKRCFAGKLNVFSPGELDTPAIACHLRKRAPADLDEIERASADAPPEPGVKLAWAPLPDVTYYRVTRRAPDGNTVVWRGEECECVVPPAPAGDGNGFRVEAKCSADDDYFTLVPFSAPTPARDDSGLMWAGPPANPDEGLDRVDETELFRAAMRTPAGEQLELTIDQVRLPGREVAFLSHSRPSPGLEAGLLVVGERRRPILYCSPDLGRTWTSVSLLKRFDRAIDRHFLLRSGRHVIMTQNPISASLVDSDGELLADFDGPGELWHGSWSVDESETGTVMFAEYRPTGKPIGGELHVWRSVDGCMSWSSALAVPGRAPASIGSIRHFHTCQADPHRPGRWYVSSGDGPRECAFWLSDDDGLNWRRIEPTFPTDLRKPELAACLLRTTSFLIRPDHLLWATDDKVNHGQAVTVRLDSTGNHATVVDRLGRNLMRSLVDLGNGCSIATSESKHNVGAASVYLLDRNGLVASQLALHNTRRRSSGFTYSTSSRAAASGTFFTRTDGSVLSTERDGFLRWRVRRQDPPRALPADVGGEPFAVVGDREVRWFPAGFTPREDDLIAFFHTQRTGGISFRRQLRRACGDDAVYSLTTLADRYRRWSQLSADDLADYRVYAGHAPYGEKPMARRWLAVGMVRDPVARIVSLYQMIRDSDGYGELSVAGEDLETWVRKVHGLKPDYVSDAQTYFLCGAPEADYALSLICEHYLGVGLTEQQDRFVAEMSRAMRWPEPEPVHLNATARAMECEVSDRARELILGINQEDQRVYEFVRDAWRIRSRPREAT